MKNKLHVNEAVLPGSSPSALLCKTGLQGLLITTLLWLWWGSQWSLKVHYTGFMHKYVICWCLCHEEIIQGRQDRQRKEKNNCNWRCALHVCYLFVFASNSTLDQVTLADQGSQKKQGGATSSGCEWDHIRSSDLIWVSSSKMDLIANKHTVFNKRSALLYHKWYKRWQILHC